MTRAATTLGTTEETSKTTIVSITTTIEMKDKKLDKKRDITGRRTYTGRAEGRKEMTTIINNNSHNNNMITETMTTA